MAFGADELRVLRRALAAVLHPARIEDDDVRACLVLAESLDEAVREAGRLRAFLLADLARYRAALPGAAAGYLELLQDALAAGYEPVPDDLAALRSLPGSPVAGALLERCGGSVERVVRPRPAEGPAAPPAPRTRLLTLVASGGAEGKGDGGKDGKGRGGGQGKEPSKPARPARPAKPPQPAQNPPGHPRPVPKPSEVFPPRRKPAPPQQERVAG